MKWHAFGRAEKGVMDTGALAPEGFITLARVVKTQGRHGEVAVQVHSDVPGRFAEDMRLQALLPDGTRRKLEIEALWPHKSLLVLKFKGVDSISAAELLVRCELQVPGTERPQLRPGCNYVSDLIGCAFLDHGNEVGRVEDVKFGAGEAPLLIVAGGAGKKFDVPFAQAYLDRVDLTQKQVRMNLPEGMLEVNAPVTAEEKREQERSGGKGKKHLTRTENWFPR